MKKIFLVAPLALAAGAVLSTPAAAQGGNYGNPGQLRAEIAQLDRQIDRRPGVSNREERVLECVVSHGASRDRRYDALSLPLAGAAHQSRSRGCGGTTLVAFHGR